MGAETSDDAGVYRVSEELALVQTVDFFTPMVDDPFDFGRIAAANALSDVYAMGGAPKTAMNLVAYPMEKLGKEVLRAVLAGGMHILEEAGVVLLGGHSVEDDEFKFGLSITGFVHPKRILKNRGLRPGDQLLLTKPLGTGIINTAIKGGLASLETIDSVTSLMATLNRTAAEVITSFLISACTDVTGFGLLGHLSEMVIDTNLSVTVDSKKVPILSEALGFAEMGLVPAGAHHNRRFREDIVKMSCDVSPELRDVLFDPQTSGGLLIGCPGNAVQELTHRLIDEGVMTAANIGEVNTHPKALIKVV